MKHPPFVSAAGRAGEDYLSEDGARALAGRIRAAWAAVGHDVQCAVLKVSTGPKGYPLQRPYYVVRTPTLVNGMPV